jgi:hypothetical protein
MVFDLDVFFKKFNEDFQIRNYEQIRCVCSTLEKELLKRGLRIFYSIIIQTHKDEFEMEFIDNAFNNWDVTFKDSDHYTIEDSLGKTMERMKNRAFKTHIYSEVFLEKFKELVNVCFIDFEMLDETTNIAPFMKRSIQYSNKCKSLITFKKIKEYFEEQNCTERCYERVFTFDEFKELAFLA